MSAWTFRYLERFRCIAERCEDTCCRGLLIPLSPRDVAELARHGVAEKAIDREQFGAAVLRKDPSGACVLLSDQGRCGLQERVGHDALPTACADFPRVHVGKGRVGTLACPEIARLALLAEDAMDQVVPGSTDPVTPVGARARLAAVLHNPDAELGPALWAIAAMADALEREDLERLETLERQANSAEWRSTFHSLPVSPAPAVTLCLQLLAAAVSTGSRRLVERVQPALSAWSAVEDLEASWNAHVAGCPPQGCDRLGRALRHLAMNALWRGGESVPTVREVLAIAVRVAVCKVLVLGAQKRSLSPLGDSLDALMVSAAQVLARELEQSPAWSALMEGLGAGTGSGSRERQLMHVLMFARP